MFDITRFGCRLSELRKKAEMSQAELAEKINVTHQAVSKYENGLCLPDISILILLSDIFCITLDELIGIGE